MDKASEDAYSNLRNLTSYLSKKYSSLIFPPHVTLLEKARLRQQIRLSNPSSSARYNEYQRTSQGNHRGTEQRSIKAVLLDRDGIINQLVYYPEHGIVDSPFTPEQLILTTFAVEAVNRFHDLGFKVIVISNQPGMAKGSFDESAFDLISLRMRELLRKGNAYLDGEYYCFHHPNGIREKYRKACDCRKPNPGLIIRAAKDHSILLAESFFVGDGLVDVKAGRKAGCKTVLVASVNGLLIRLLTEQDAEPDYLVRTVEEAVRTVENYCKSHRTA